MSFRSLLAAWLGLLVTALASFALADQAPKKIVELKISSDELEHVLDLNGLTPEQAKQRLQNPGGIGLPPIPKVPLRVVLNNNSDQPVTVDDINGWYVFELKGPDFGEMKLTALQQTNPRPAPRKPKVIQAGDSHTHIMDSISHSVPGGSITSVWLKPGKYTLQAKGTVQINGKAMRIESNTLTFEIKPEKN